jgi:hypothetical protein
MRKEMNLIGIVNGTNPRFHKQDPGGIRLRTRRTAGLSAGRPVDAGTQTFA